MGRINAPAYIKLSVIIIIAIFFNYRFNRWIYKKLQPQQKQSSDNPDFQYQPVEHNQWAKPLAFVCSGVVFILTFLFVSIVWRRFYL